LLSSTGRRDPVRRLAQRVSCTPVTSIDDRNDRYDFCPWLFWVQASDEERDRQLAWQEVMRGRGLREIGTRSFVSPLAAVHPDVLTVGAESYIAAHVYLTDDVTMGDHTTLNPFATVRGRVRLGDGVRVGAHTSLLGFNHSMEPDAPVYEQPLTITGITVGDDVWIGSNAIVLDGVTIGAHSVIAAGAVVTRDVPPWSVMAGNPARRLRDRREPRARDRAVRVGQGLAGFADEAREQASALLLRYRYDSGQPCSSDQPGFVDQPGAAATVRATCDAVEIADLLLGGPPPGTAASELASWLVNRQDPDTGLVPELGSGPSGSTASPFDAWPARYHILAVGYALELLGSSFRHPVHAVAQLDAEVLVSTLDGLPWTDQAWSCGDWIDGYATGLYWNRATFGLDGPLETLFGWLQLRQDQWSGLWGSPTPAEGRRQPVNGYYRLTRGSFAQFGIPVPNPEATIDSVLAHCRDARFFTGGRGTACDVLDVIHPLWLCGQQTGYRQAEVREWAGQRLTETLARWQPAAGFAFDPGPGRGGEHDPSLMGTEMWLAIIWLLADVLGETDALGYRPRGVHRPEPRRSRGSNRWSHPGGLVSVAP
jgi:acetyltransferase-like isoleucine patch superfamily enzyme